MNLIQPAILRPRLIGHIRLLGDDAFESLFAGFGEHRLALAGMMIAVA